MPSPFVPVAEAIVDAMLTASPSTALRAGDHRVDDRLDDFSTDGVARQVAALRDASDALDQLDPDPLDPAERVDHEILRARVDRGLFELTELREHEWNPLLHNPGTLLYALIDRPTGGIEQRLHNLASRLAAVPDALADARATLTGCPRVHLETSVGQFAGTARLVADEVPKLLAERSAMAGEVEPAMAAALAAFAGLDAWLRAQLAADAERREPRLGRRLWEARLWHTLDTELTAAQVLDAAKRRLAEVTVELREAAVAYVGGRQDDDTVRRALDRCAGSRPDNASIVGFAAGTLAETSAFVREQGLVSLVDDPCLVREMPEYARGVSVAYCQPPGPLETAEIPTLYCIAPTPAGWSPERVESFYREYNDMMVHNLTVHEAMPGHFLQLAHARRYTGSTRVRALCASGPFIEGWGVYAEQIMADAGYGGPAVRLQQLKMQLRAILNAILDQLVHCDELTEGEAMAMMIGQAFQEDGEAAGKWRRALLTSTQLSTYFVGYTEVSAIAAARPAGEAPGTWHDRMLGYGSPPPRHLRTLLGV
jgi:uncharacterized protein (DUF885 family)